MAYKSVDQSAEKQLRHELTCKNSSSLLYSLSLSLVMVLKVLKSHRIKFKLGISAIQLYQELS